MIFPELPPVVDFRKMPWAAVPAASPACRSTLIAAALASDVWSGSGLTCEILSVPWLVSWPDTSHALKAGVSRDPIQAGVVRSTIGRQVEHSDMVTRGDGCGFRAEQTMIPLLDIGDDYGWCGS